MANIPNFAAPKNNYGNYRQFMTNKKTTYLVCGFLLFMFGFLALILQFVGIQFTFLTWIDHFGNLTGFVLRLIMIITGIVFAAHATMNTENDDAGQY